MFQRLKQRMFYLLSERKRFHDNTCYLPISILAITCLHREHVITDVKTLLYCLQTWLYILFDGVKAIQMADKWSKNSRIAYSWFWNWFLWFLRAKLLHCVVILLLVFRHKHLQRFSRLKQFTAASEFMKYAIERNWIFHKTINIPLILKGMCLLGTEKPVEVLNKQRML